MNDTILNAIVTLLKTLAIFQNSDGSSRVYDFPEHEPTYTGGFPYAYVVYTKTESSYQDSQMDKVNYTYQIRVLQEKLADNFGSQKAEQTTRQREYEICSLFRQNNSLNRTAGVIRTMPMNVIKGFDEQNTRITLDINLVVQTMEQITF